MKSATNCDIVYKLLKALYRLKQYSYFHYKWLSSFFLKRLELRCINTDYSIFVTNAILDGPVINIFINNINIIISKNSRIINYVKLELISAYLIVYISFISFYLSLKVERNPKNTKIKLS